MAGRPSSLAPVHMRVDVGLGQLDAMSGSVSVGLLQNLLIQPRPDPEPEADPEQLTLRLAALLLSQP